MKVSVILGHPGKRSFGQAIAGSAIQVLEQNGYEVLFHDLYEENFDPVLPGDEIPEKAELDPVIAKHCEEISDADGIIVIHPNWWGQPPAILKGWVDRVLRVGVAFRFIEDDQGEGIPVGLLRAKAALVFTTSNTPLKREMEVFGDPLENLWKTCIFDLCGVKVFHRTNFGAMVMSTPEQRGNWLEDVKNRVGEYFPG